MSQKTKRLKKRVKVNLKKSEGGNTDPLFLLYLDAVGEIDDLIGKAK